MGELLTLGTSARRIVIAILLMSAASVCLDADATTARSVELTLSGTEQENLVQLACQGPAQSLSVRRQIDPPLYVLAEIQCESHAQYQEHPVAKFVECRRAADSSWGCGVAVPTIEIPIMGGRTIHIQHRDVTSQEALDVIAFLLGEPKYRNVTVQREWVVDGTSIHRTDSGLLVGAPPYYFGLHVDAAPGAPRFSIAEISVCKLDVCYPLHLAEPR